MEKKDWGVLNDALSGMLNEIRDTGVPLTDIAAAAQANGVNWSGQEVYTRMSGRVRCDHMEEAALIVRLHNEAFGLTESLPEALTSYAGRRIGGDKAEHVRRIADMLAGLVPEKGTLVRCSAEERYAARLLGVEPGRFRDEHGRLFDCSLAEHMYRLHAYEASPTERREMVAMIVSDMRRSLDREPGYVLEETA